MAAVMDSFSWLLYQTSLPAAISPCSCRSACPSALRHHVMGLLFLMPEWLVTANAFLQNAFCF